MTEFKVQMTDEELEKLIDAEARITYVDAVSRIAAVMMAQPESRTATVESIVATSELIYDRVQACADRRFAQKQAYDDPNQLRLNYRRAHDIRCTSHDKHDCELCFGTEEDLT